jgi:TolA-binding protein
MTVYCRYHVLEPAEWRCTDCSVDYCGICSPEPPEEENQQPRKCPRCKATLRPLGGSHSAPPFWQSLTAFLRYPISPLAGVLMFLALVLPLVVPEGTILMAAKLLFLAAATIYLWAVLEVAATGNLEPIGPKLFASTAAKDQLPLSLGVMLAVMAGAAGFVSERYGFVGSVLAAVLVGLLPALLIGVALTKSIASGFSKQGVVTVLAGVGPVYAAVFLLPVLLLGGVLAFVGLFTDVLPRAAGEGLTLAAYTYVATSIFALSGYVLFQYQESLDYTPEGAQGKRKHARKIDPVQLQFEMLLKEGDYSKAVSLLKTDVDRKSATISHHDRYHRLVWALGQEENLRAHATPYFKALLGAGRGVQAATVFRNILQRYPDFKLTEPEVRLDLAQAFDQQGDFKLAVHILNGLHKDNPHFPGLPEAYLLAARLLAEKLNMPQKALALVQFLQGRYRNHRSFAEINRMNTELSKQLGIA